MGNEAAKLGNDALRRLSSEVEHRPLVTLAVAVGVGMLIGVARPPLMGGPAPASCLSMIFSENRCPLFGIMLQRGDQAAADFRLLKIPIGVGAQRPRQALTRRSRRFAVRSKNKA